MKTDAKQSGEEYREAFDVTAPPDPVARGTTSDVPIHGEATNVLFHPTVGCHTCRASASVIHAD